MAKKRQIKKNGLQSANPLNNIETFDPGQLATGTSTKSSNQAKKLPASPLGPPQRIQPNPQQPIDPAPRSESSLRITQLEAALSEAREAQYKLERRNFELETAVSRTTTLEEELKEERAAKLELIKQIAALEVKANRVLANETTFAEEREKRFQLEKKLATLEVRAERTQEMAAQLADAQKARVILEREKATLDVQVESMKKLDKLLTEERQARMNAQSRAASAESQLARLEGELGNFENKGRRSFTDRLRGR
ncbi:MAG: hypothetical protein DWQ04_23695 [Chloroflexi bacterium]|nr:MAG: hypothetical protein DWQ04_23695 [Chloroflexota bacterium]